MSVTFDFDVKSSKNFSPVSCYNYGNLNSMVMFVCTVILQTVVRASLQMEILLENFSHYYPTCLSSHVFLPEGCSGCCCGSPLCDSISSVENLLFFRRSSTPSSGTAAGDSFPCSALVPLCFSDPPAQSREQNKD